MAEAEKKEEDDGAQCVKVAVRCRPPSTKEKNAGEANIVDMVEAFLPHEVGKGQVCLSDPSGAEEPAKFAFDIVFGLDILQSDIYNAVGLPALIKCFEGYNGTIFAYGQTGSGKSFTMAGAEGDLRGIMPRVNCDLFAKVKEQSVGTRLFLVQCSYFEIYNEIIYDLLNPQGDRNKLGGGLQVKEHPVLGIYVKDLTEVVATDPDKLETMLAAGNKNRAVASTMMNSTSSRSHSIFTIKMDQKDSDDPSRNVFAKLNLVDLAGSERQKGTGATGQTLKEGANINKSLSALGNVINALVESANGKKVFIPYRNSKLTRVLQESLGGNSLCSMLATLSPAACNYEETMSTLRYANRAKAIKVSATKNEEASQISRLKAEVEELKKKLETGGPGAGSAASRCLSESERQQEQSNYEHQLKEMEKMIDSNWGNKAQLSEEHEKKMQRFAEERRVAEQAIQEERARRLKLLQEKNDLELTIKGLVDFVTHVPKIASPPAVLTGEQPRSWVKMQRPFKLSVEELKEQCTLVMVYKHAFDEDVRLWGEGAEANDMGLAATGLTRCISKLDRLRKGGEKLLQLQVETIGPATELLESVRQAIDDMEKPMNVVKSELEADSSSKSAQSRSSAFGEVCHMLDLVLEQVQDKMQVIEKTCEIEMLETCEMVLQFSRSLLDDDEDCAVIKTNCAVLESLNMDPSLAALPASMPSKPLREYGPEDVQNTPETTEALLGQLIRWEGLCGGKTRKTALELLSRPPPKFLLDVATAIKKVTGFPADLAEDWPDARDGKLARFQCIVDAVSQGLNITVDFEPADVLKGKEVPKTLHILQLLAVAAAKSLPVGGSGLGVDSRRAGVTRPRELPTMFDAIVRCIDGIKQRVELKKAETGTKPGEQSLEEKIANVQERLQEESRSRMRQEDKIGNVEKTLQEALNEIKHVEQEFEMTNAGHDPEEEELKRQLEALTKDASNPEAIPDADIIKMLHSQVEDVRRELTKDDNDKLELDDKQQELAKKLHDAVSQAKAVEADVLRERQRKDMEDELMGQSPEEQKMILEAYEKKARIRVETIEAQISGLQGEAQDRKTGIDKARQTKTDLMGMVEENQLQMQIAEEERDAMREAMEQLFAEKAAVDQELDDRQTGYVGLTERLNQLEDDTCELQDLVLRKQEGLQKQGQFNPGIASAAA